MHLSRTNLMQKSVITLTAGVLAVMNQTLLSEKPYNDYTLAIHSHSSYVIQKMVNGRLVCNVPSDSHTSGNKSRLTCTSCKTNKIPLWWDLEWHVRGTYMQVWTFVAILDCGLPYHRSSA